MVVVVMYLKRKEKKCWKFNNSFSIWAKKNYKISWRIVSYGFLINILSPSFCSLLLNTSVQHWKHELSSNFWSSVPFCCCPFPLSAFCHQLHFHLTHVTIHSYERLVNNMPFMCLKFQLLFCWSQLVNAWRVFMSAL